jgi:hypothetical protein
MYVGSVPVFGSGLTDFDQGQQVRSVSVPYRLRARRKAHTERAAGPTVPSHEIHIGTDHDPKSRDQPVSTLRRWKTATTPKMVPEISRYGRVFIGSLEVT